MADAPQQRTDWAKTPVWERVLALILLFVIVFGALALILLGESGINRLWLAELRGLICWIFVFLGGVWFLVKRGLPKSVIGAIEVTAAFLSNYHQLGKLIQSPGYDVYERLTFIVAGLAVTAKGFEHIAEGWNKEKVDNAVRAFVKFMNYQ